MTQDFNRLIGLTRERQIEDECGVVDLHIGWQDESPKQKQLDPAGRVHRAPLVSWIANGERATFVPTLRFLPNEHCHSWLRDLLAIEEDPEFCPDVDQLEQDIRRILTARSDG